MWKLSVHDMNFQLWKSSYSVLKNSLESTSLIQFLKYNFLVTTNCFRALYQDLPVNVGQMFGQTLWFYHMLSLQNMFTTNIFKDDNA